MSPQPPRQRHAPSTQFCCWQPPHRRTQGRAAPRQSTSRFRDTQVHAAPRRDTALCRATASLDDAGSAWSRLSLAKRQLALAVAEEDYELCTQLKAEVFSLEARLPPQKQLLLALLDKLQGADGRDRVTAAQALGDLGDVAALVPLQALLADDDVGSVCESSMWCIFMQAPSVEVDALMARGVAALAHPSRWEQAVEIFTQIIAAAPDFAEAGSFRMPPSAASMPWFLAHAC
jgi:hypothetical protein